MKKLLKLFEVLIILVCMMWFSDLYFEYCISQPILPTYIIILIGVLLLITWVVVINYLYKKLTNFLKI